jgi:hypothetical protein
MSSADEAVQCCPARGPLAYPATVPASIKLEYVAFFDFECTGYEPFAVAIQVVGFPTNAASEEDFLRFTLIEDQHVCVAKTAFDSVAVGGPEFEPSTKTWWMRDENKPARDHMLNTYDCKDGFSVPGIVRFIDDMRVKYPGLRFATDNPTLDARYLDNIMDRLRSPRVSMRADGSWARVLAVDDLRAGFELATGTPIPKQPACVLRTLADEIPPHAPDGDVLQIAADYSDLLMAAAKRRKVDDTGTGEK